MRAVAAAFAAAILCVDAQERMSEEESRRTGTPIELGMTHLDPPPHGRPAPILPMLNRPG